MPTPIASPSPKRQKSVPTQVLTVRTAFAYACPDGIPSSSQMRGSCSLRMPSRSIRWPPVIFTIGTSWRSATSAIRRSSAGVVTPPRMRGTTENVPSFWMFAWTRSLMKRAWRSSRWRLAATSETR